MADDVCGAADEHLCKMRDSKSHPSSEKYWWHVNKSGFPVEDATWERMWEHAIEVHPEGKQLAESIRGKRLNQVIIATDEDILRIFCKV